MAALHIMVVLNIVIVLAKSQADVEETNMCKSDREAAAVCNACSQLSFAMSAMDVSACCYDLNVLEMCDSCTQNPQKCLDEVIALENEIIEQKLAPSMLESGAIEEDNGVSKRYGRIFFGSRPSNYITKRYGRLFFGNRNGYRLKRPSEPRKQKRFGKLFMNKKSPSSEEEEGKGHVEKRYGRLFMTPYVDKRYGSLSLGKPRSNVYYWK